MFRISIPVSVATLTAVAVVLLVTSAPVLAGHYELVKGKGVEVCEAYMKALNAASPKLPYACERPLPQDSGDFREPRWEELDIREYEFLPKVWRYRWERDVNPVNFYGAHLWRSWRGTPEQLRQAWQNYLSGREEQGVMWQYLARFDLDNDGQDETVYLDRLCGPAGGRSLFVVLNADQTDIDLDKTERAQAHPSRKAMGLGDLRPAKKGEWGVPPTDVSLGISPVPHAFSNATYDFFIFRNITYFDLWWQNHPNYKGKPPWEVGRLRVFMIEDGLGSQEICTYRFDSEGFR